MSILLNTSYWSKHVPVNCPISLSSCSPTTVTTEGPPRTKVGVALVKGEGLVVWGAGQGARVAATGGTMATAEMGVAACRVKEVRDTSPRVMQVPEELEELEEVATSNKEEVRRCNRQFAMPVYSCNLHRNLVRWTTLYQMFQGVRKFVLVITVSSSYLILVTAAMIKELWAIQHFVTRSRGGMKVAAA